MAATQAFVLTVSTEYEGCDLIGVYLDPASARGDFEALVAAHCVATGRAPVDPEVADDGEISVAVADQSFVLSPVDVQGASGLAVADRIWALSAFTQDEGADLRGVYFDLPSARSDYEEMVAAHCVATGQPLADPEVAGDGEISVTVADQQFVLTPVVVDGRHALA